VADIGLGVLAIIVGIAFCFRGYVAMRLIIPLWGAFSGFILGAGLVASLAGEGFLSSLLGWLAGLGHGARVRGARVPVLRDLGVHRDVGVDDDWWWYATYLVLVVAGIASQMTAAARIRGSLRAAWTESGGRQMRAV